MPVPNLLHPVDIEIEQLSTATTDYDHDAREPVQFASRPEVKTVEGQVHWGAEVRVSHTRTGAGEDADGYVLFRYVDLEAKSVTLKREDRFRKIGNIETDVYIKRLRPTGHYPDMGGATMVKAFFEDRQPSKTGT